MGVVVEPLVGADDVRGLPTAAAGEGADSADGAEDTGSMPKGAGRGDERDVGCCWWEAAVVDRSVVWPAVSREDCVECGE